MRVIKVWTLPVRLMHWSMVGAFAVAMWTRDSELERMIHVEAGYVIAAVLLSRLLYGFVARDLAAFRRFPLQPLKGLRYTLDLMRGEARNYLGHNPAGALAIYAMLTLGVLTVATGYWAFEYDDDFAKTWHHHFAYAWFWVVCVHLTGVLLGSLAHREFLVQAMITGYKVRRPAYETFTLEAVGMTLLIAVLRVIGFIGWIFGNRPPRAGK